ncbi:MAG: DUF1796 family putative cysteine peptidase [Thermodesulfovibrionales bacterium]
MTDTETIQKIVSSLNKAKKSIRVLARKEPFSAISIGQNCNTAWYLKQVGARTEAYPFDWIFCSAEIIESCMRDGFSIFLDRQYITPKKDRHAAGHSVYHENMFHHRSPIQTEEDYNYYVRCIERFKRKLSSGDRIMFVCTLINEPDKRPAWSSGFCNKYLLPTAQSYDTYESFMKYAGEINPNLIYLFIEQYTQGKLTIDSEIVKDNVLSIKFTSQGSNDGVMYLDEFDDSIVKSLYSGLII